MSEKIQKLLANAGLGSRRQIEDWIRAGRITVKGQLAHIGERITPEAAVCLDGRLLQLVKSYSIKTRVLLYNKPEGEICTRSDPEKRPTVFENLPLLRNGRWIAVGRLDINTQGLILFTNNGELANQLMHPRAQLEREYAVRVRGKITQPLLQRLREGVQLDDGLAAFESLTEVPGEGQNRWFHVIVKEGRHRLVRRLWESQALQISRLLRIRFGSLLLPRNLGRGQWQELEKEAVQQLRDELENSA